MSSSYQRYHEYLAAHVLTPFYQARLNRLDFVSKRRQ